MFETLTEAPPDAIFGLGEAFKADPNPAKINLSVGVYKDAQGRTPVLNSVKGAEERLLQTEATKGYLSIEGSPEFAQAVGKLLWNGGVAPSGLHSASAHTPGGTAALRVAADLLKGTLGKKKIWISDPTWPNHPSIFKAAGLETATYPYFDAQANRLDIERCLAALEQVPSGDVVLLHACCHNPTGVDPTPGEWQGISEVVGRRGLFPLLDFAYQGFGDGLVEDAVGLRALCQPGREMLVASSMSKNFGLYNERVGALTLVGASDANVARALGHVRIHVRANYSNPPAHGAAVVSTIMADESLAAQWREELHTMRVRIHTMRQKFVESLQARGTPGEWSFIARQRGMFSFSGLTAAQVDTLRTKYAIYIVRNGRINVAGMTAQNMDALCDALHAVVTGAA